MGGSSIFAESARAVDREMLGSDNEGVLMGGDPEARKACS